MPKEKHLKIKIERNKFSFEGSEEGYKAVMSSAPNPELLAAIFAHTRQLPAAKEPVMEATVVQPPIYQLPPAAPQLPPQPLTIPSFPRYEEPVQPQLPPAAPQAFVPLRDQSSSAIAPTPTKPPKQPSRIAATLLQGAKRIDKHLNTWSAVVALGLFVASAAIVQKPSLVWNALDAVSGKGAKTVPAKVVPAAKPGEAKEAPKKTSSPSEPNPPPDPAIPPPPPTPPGMETLPP